MQCALEASNLVLLEDISNDRRQYLPIWAALYNYQSIRSLYTR